MTDRQVRIEVGEYVLRSYAHGWEIGRPRIDTDQETGEETERLTGTIYPSTLTSALKALLELRLRASGATSLDQLREGIAEFKAEIDGIMPRFPH